MLSGLARFWPLGGYARRRQAAATLAQLIASAFSDTEPSGSATATFTLANNGNASGGPVTDSGSGAYAWLLSGLPAECEVVVAMVGGTTFSSGSGAGTFNLGTTRSWSVTRSTAGTKTATASFTIQLAGGGTVLAGPTNVTLTATIDAGSGGGGDGGFGGGGGHGGGGGDIPV